MKSRFPKETIIRQYLLGHLDDQQELEESLSEEMLFNNELSEMVDAIEDEIIEEYLDETLGVADMESFEKYFLQPPERKEKLRFARLLRRHFDPYEHDSAQTKEIPAAVTEYRGGFRGTTNGVIAYWRGHTRTYLELFTIVVLSILSLVYNAGLHSRLTHSSKKQMQLENELKQEREHSVILTAQLQEALRPSVPLKLRAQDVFQRHGVIPPSSSHEQLQRAEIAPATQRISISLGLEANSAAAYDVRLENAEGKKIWSARLHPLVSSSESAQLVFEMPVGGISDGEYSFAVFPLLRGGGKSYRYRFLVRNTH